MRLALLAALLAASVAGAQDITADIYDGPPNTYFLARAHPVNFGVAFDFFTDLTMTAGYLVYFCNGVQPAFAVDYAGNASLSGGMNVGGTLVLSAEGSGEASIHSANNNYLTLWGDLPIAYWGVHGAVAFLNAHPMIAGYIAEFANPDSNTGAMTDKKLVVNYQGGLTQLGQYQEAQLAPCGDYENAPFNDGGAGYYVATDAGVAHMGTLMFPVDKKRWCMCRPDLGDGGAAGTTGDGWVRVTDERPCSENRFVLPRK